jgi:hypothetical protein
MSEAGTTMPQNQMMGPQAPATAGGVAEPGVPDLAGLLPHMEGALQQHVTKYDKLSEIAGKATVMRETLDSLVKKGDMIDQDDLIDAAGKLVSRGFPAAEIASFLAEAPENGEALQGWIMQHDMKLRQNEMQLKEMQSITRHQMGVNALRLLGAHSMAAMHGFGMEPQSTLASPQAQAAQASGAANDLTGGGAVAQGPETPASSTANALGA